jgi:hypothetical protein
MILEVQRRIGVAMASPNISWQGITSSWDKVNESTVLMRASLQRYSGFS